MVFLMHASEQRMLCRNPARCNSSGFDRTTFSNTVSEVCSKVFCGKSTLERIQKLTYLHQGVRFYYLQVWLTQVILMHIYKSVRLQPALVDILAGKVY